MTAHIKARSAVIAIALTAAAVAISTIARSQSSAQSGAESSTPPATQAYPAPRNLQILPKELTGLQVHEIMQKWSEELGVRCVACHVQDPIGLVPGALAARQFADDSKPMKRVARLMYTMTEKINGDFIAKVEGSGMPVTCGTCHRGNISPEPFAPTIESQPEAIPTSPVAERSSSR